MPENKISFGGFDSEPKYQKVHDLPPRPYPQPLPIEEPRQTWTPQVEQEIKHSDTNKILIVNMVNLALPIIGLTILIGGITSVVLMVTSFYN